MRKLLGVASIVLTGSIQAAQVPMKQPQVAHAAVRFDEATTERTASLLIGLGLLSFAIYRPRSSKH